MTVELQAPPEPSVADHNGPAVGIGMTLGGFRSLRRNDARALEQQAVAFIASSPGRDAGLVRRYPGVYELRFGLTWTIARSRGRQGQRGKSEGEALARELCARMTALAETAGHVASGAFGFEFFPLGFVDPPPKTATILQAGALRTPLQWRRLFDPEPY